MMVEVSFERLYLAKNCKDSKDIYINKSPLVQHQLDGIRYLYRALKKKKQAVILNDPSGYGKRVQITLFMSAVLHTLDKPALILCREGMEQRWMDNFLQWTEVSEDVAIEMSNAFIKIKVVISPLYCTTEFARRQWSILVVDDDHLPRDLLKSSLKADFKIWITSSAIKEDLSKYTTFHSWVYPKDKFDTDRFSAKKGDLKDTLLKKVMLDAFLEDTVLRRECGIIPFTEAQVSSNTEQKTTKKYKDTSGTKIKRSKRKSADADDKTTAQSKIARINKIEHNTEVFEIGYRTDEQSNDAKNISLEETAIDVTKTQSDDNFVPSYNKSKKSKILWDSDSDDEIKATDIEIDNFRNQDEHNDSESYVLHWDSDTNEHKETAIDSDNVIITNTNEPIKVNEIDSKNVINESKVNEILENKSTGAIVTNSVSEDIFQTNTNEIIEVNDNKMEYKDQPVPSTTKESGENAINVHNKPEANLSSFELKMKELEELTLKKYKGSLLDKIF